MPKYSKSSLKSKNRIDPYIRINAPKPKRRCRHREKLQAFMKKAKAGPSQGSLFEASRKVKIRGGQFSSSKGHHANFTFNFNQPAMNDAVEGDSIQYPQTSQRPSTTDEERDSILFCGYPPLPVRRSCDTYYRHVATQGRGSPLWQPGPSSTLPDVYRRQGVAIGDVGIITKFGGFDVMFNICHSADHPINQGGLPEGFAPLSPPLQSRDIHKHTVFNLNSYLASASVERSRENDSSGIAFESSASEGAILTMPQGAQAQDLANVSRFRQYLSDNAESWYRYVNNVCGREARNGDVRLVIGCDKASAWGIATFANSSTQDFHLEFKPTGESGSKQTYEWEYSGIADARAGPDAEEMEELRSSDDSWPLGEYRNQCLFLRTLNATLRDDVWHGLGFDFETAVGIQCDSYPNSYIPSSSSGSSIRSPTPTDPSHTNLASGAGTTRSLGVLQKPLPSVHIADFNTTFTGHPSKTINAFLLAANPSARLAITEDNDWTSLIVKGDRRLPPPEELINRLLITHEVCEVNSVVSLEFKKRSKPSSMSSDSGDQVNTLLFPELNSLQTDMQNIITKIAMSGHSRHPFFAHPLSCPTSEQPDGLYLPFKMKHRKRMARGPFTTTFGSVDPKLSAILRKLNKEEGAVQIWFQNGFAKDKYRQHAAHLPKDLKLVLGGAVSACSTYRDEAAAKKEPHVVNPAAQPSAPVLRPSLFAVICGINDYKSNDFPRLRGAVQDAKAVVDLLISNYHVPRNQICALFNEAATRSGIISALNGLSTDPRIQYGDPILFYYAGHGSEIYSSEGQECDGPGLKMQAIVPHDCCSESGVPVIPDRTIGVLLDEIANRKGNNITVIFDSCHSSSLLDLNGGFDACHSSTLLDLNGGSVRSAELDSSIHMNTFGQNFRDERAPHYGRSSHVLLAACGSSERAREESNGRGAFTTRLLQLLREVSPDELRYRDIPRKIGPMVDQNPQCEGTHQDRYLFNAKITSPAPVSHVPRHDPDCNAVVINNVESVAQEPNRPGKPLGAFVIAKSTSFSSIMKLSGHLSISASFLPSHLRPFQVKTGSGNALRLDLPKLSGHLTFPGRLDEILRVYGTYLRSIQFVNFRDKAYSITARATTAIQRGHCISVTAVTWDPFWSKAQHFRQESHRNSASTNVIKRGDLSKPMSRPSSSTSTLQDNTIAWPLRKLVRCQTDANPMPLRNLTYICQWRGATPVLFCS